MPPVQPSALTILTPDARPRRPFPWVALSGVVLVALATGVLVLRPDPRAAPIDVGLKVIALFAGCTLAHWVEERIYLAAGRAGRVGRLLISIGVPLGAFFFAVFGASAIRPWLAQYGERSTTAMFVFASFAWLGSAAVGSLIVVVMDYAISTVVPDLRTRITLAVLTLLALVGLTTFGLVRLLPAYAARVASDKAAISAQLGAMAFTPDEIERLLRFDEQVAVLNPDVQRLLQVPEEYRVLRASDLELLFGGSGASGAFTFLLFLIAGLLGLPAVLSASTKLADAIMERVHPLSRALHLVSRGRLDVRVEEAGSEDFVHLNRHFNQMVQSLSEAQRIERAFGLYVSEHIRERIRNQHGVVIPASLRDATVLFADIRGFTAFSERLDPADVLELLNRYFERVVPIVEQYEGYLDKFVGDALMVVFNGPLDQLDHAERAVRCGIALQEEMDRLNKEGVFERLGSLAIGVGIATGPLVAGNLGSARKMEYTVVGDTVNLASRLTAHAGAGEVWVNQGCVEALPPTVPRVAVGPVVIKGKQQPVLPFRVWPFDESTEKVQAAS